MTEASKQYFCAAFFVIATLILYLYYDGRSSSTYSIFDDDDDLHASEALSKAVRTRLRCNVKRDCQRLQLSEVDELSHLQRLVSEQQAAMAVNYAVQRQRETREWNLSQLSPYEKQLRYYVTTPMLNTSAVRRTLAEHFVERHRAVTTESTRPLSTLAAMALCSDRALRRRAVLDVPGAFTVHCELALLCTPAIAYRVRTLSTSGGVLVLGAEHTDDGCRAVFSELEQALRDRSALLRVDPRGPLPDGEADAGRKFDHGALGDSVVPAVMTCADVRALLATRGDASSNASWMAKRPFASGAYKLVYRARFGGRDAVVKMTRPGKDRVDKFAEQIEDEMQLLRALGALNPMRPHRYLMAFFGACIGKRHGAEQAVVAEGPLYPLSRYFKRCVQAECGAPWLLHLAVAARVVRLARFMARAGVLVCEFTKNQFGIDVGTLDIKILDLGSALVVLPFDGGNLTAAAGATVPCIDTSDCTRLTRFPYDSGGYLEYLTHSREYAVKLWHEYKRRQEATSKDRAKARKAERKLEKGDAKQLRKEQRSAEKWYPAHLSLRKCFNKAPFLDDVQCRASTEKHIYPMELWRNLATAVKREYAVARRAHGLPVNATAEKEHVSQQIMAIRDHELLDINPAHCTGFPPDAMLMKSWERLLARLLPVLLAADDSPDAVRKHLQGAIENTIVAPAGIFDGILRAYEEAGGDQAVKDAHMAHLIRKLRDEELDAAERDHVIEGEDGES